jgi:hypothetical protein
MRHDAGQRDLAWLCRRVPVPVFVRAASPEIAFALGASGLNQITY